ncbi:hypothetical protein HK096_010419, partial [Nowakowskiella sp. JEL0078]
MDIFSLITTAVSIYKIVNEKLEIYESAGYDFSLVLLTLEEINEISERIKNKGLEIPLKTQVIIAQGITRLNNLSDEVSKILFFSPTEKNKGFKDQVKTSFRKIYGIGTADGIAKKVTQMGSYSKGILENLVKIENKSVENINTDKALSAVVSTSVTYNVEDSEVIRLIEKLTSPLLRLDSICKDLESQLEKAKKQGKLDTFQEDIYQLENSN